MSATKIVVILAFAGLTSAFPFPQQEQQTQDNQQQFDPQLLSYHLQQLQRQGLQVQPQQFQTQPQQFQAQQESQQQLPQQYLRQTVQAAPERQAAVGATSPLRSLQQQQLAQQQQSLLGVAYSAAADVSKTTYNSNLVKYSF